MAKGLSANLVESFDEEFVNEGIWEIIKTCIDRDFPDGNFIFLDIGGGNGLFADRVLQNYPKCSGTVLDSSRFLLDKNTQNDRKTLICRSVEDIHQVFAKKQFDIIFINWVLHHLVHNYYVSSKRNIVYLLQMIRPLLTSRGRISVLENVYDGFPLDYLPSFLIFYAASSKVLAPIIRRLGVHSAGVGICFLSKNQWESVFRNAHLRINMFTEDEKWRFPIWLKIFLFLKEARVAHYWCTKGIGESG